jgi:hypothetical protein
MKQNRKEVRTIRNVNKHVKKGEARCENINILDLVDYKKHNDEKFFGDNNTYSKMIVWDEYISMR